MNVLEIIGALTLCYVSVGTIWWLLADSSSTEQEGWLAELVYLFLLIASWPIVLIEPLVPGVHAALWDPEEPDSGSGLNPSQKGRGSGQEAEKP